MNSMVGDLVMIIDGATEPVAPTRQSYLQQQPRATATVVASTRRTQAKQLNKAETIIPLDDSDFTDF